MRLIIAIAAIPILLLPAALFGQSSGALGGTVADPSQAVLPGATITAINNDTGVKTTASANNAGVYNFPALQPGIYKVTAEMPGFQTTTKTEVDVRMAGSARLNFELAIAGVSTQIEVSTSAQSMMLESNPSTGTLLQENTVSALPLISNDMMDLINVMGGVVRAEDQIFSNAQQTFAGVAASNVNIQRDGITVNEVRWNSGIVSPARLNPDMVGEFKLVLSPVDAEMGRGAGQVQVLTKSGGNALHGSGVWTVQNSALDANEWNNNRLGQEPNWRNSNEYTINVSGPIKKNKTFFFAYWNQAISRMRQDTRKQVLTPCAKKGIFRYFDGWINGNTQSAITTASGTNIRPVVNASGTPLVPDSNRDGSPYTGVASPGISIQGLRYESVLGALTQAAKNQIIADPINCSQFNISLSDWGVTSGSNWDPYRKAYDKSGYASRFSELMPAANDYYIGDGLNVADLRWNRTVKGQDTVYGNGMDNLRKSFNVKIDHNLSNTHRISGTYSYESDFGENFEPTWPTPKGYGGSTRRWPQNVMFSLTSTLRPTLLNEFRFGYARTSTQSYEPSSEPATGSKMVEILNNLMPTKGWPKYDGYPIVVGIGGGGQAFFSPDTYGLGTINYSHPYGSRGANPTSRGGVDPRTTFANTLTWTRGVHSFKGGAEVRLSHSFQRQNGYAGFVASSNAFPMVQAGYTSFTPPTGVSSTTWTGLVGTNSGASSTGNVATAYGLMNYMAGGVGSVRQYYFVNSASQRSWNDATKGELERVLDINEREFSIFFKDDWKLSPSLTINLGLRYEYYGVPWVASGMTTGLVGGPQSIFGGGGDFSNWLQNPTYNSSKLTAQQFIGPNSPNPDISPIHKDLNNFGPAVGFAWQLPWLGKGKTTLRGGYQVSYVTIGSLDPNSGMGLALANAPGTVTSHVYAGDSVSYPYMDMTMLSNLVPTIQFMDPAIVPLAVRPVTDRTQAMTAYDENIRSPYIQSLTMSLTRNIGSNLTVDVRYIGTLSRKLVSGINLNAVNFINNGLKDAFNLARAGQESSLLDKLILPNTLMGGYTSGAEQLRRSTITRTNLAVGDYATLAGTLATSNGCAASSTCKMPATSSGIAGALLRYSGTPENFIYTNPQFLSATMQGNNQHSNYHSMQVQVNLRPTHNLSLQATYTWSRNLGDAAGGTTDVLDRAADYGVLSSNRPHSFTGYGTYELPLGSKGYLFRNSSKAVKKIVDGWQLSWIATMTSGLPASITQTNSMWGGTGVDLVNASLFNTKGGKVTWAPGAAAGYYYGSQYTQVDDPQCNGVSAGVVSGTTTLRNVCTTSLKALALASDPTQIVFQHAAPGVRGNFAPNQLIGPGRWGLDMTMGKNIEFMEGKSINIRIDAQNICNHPTPSGTTPLSYNTRNVTVYNPNFAINSTTLPFGYLQYKGQHRTFSAKIRLAF
jgi:hypothetical protein